MNDEKRRTAARKALEAHIASRGMRATPERFAILDSLMSLRVSFDVAALGEKLAADGFRVSRATLYNSLHLFEQAGIVARSRAGEADADARVWEIVADRGVTITLVCTRCGRRRNVRDQALTRQLMARRFSSFTATGIDVCVRGLCPRCRKLSSQPALF